MRPILRRASLLLGVVTAAVAFGAVSTGLAQASQAGQIQGEYILSGATERGKEVYGVQVAASGEGSFRAVVFPGGLPGAGAKLGVRAREVLSRAVQGGLVFVERQTVVTFTEDGSITVKNSAFDSLVAKMEKVERVSPTVGAKAPEGAVVLFDGTSADRFENGRVSEDGSLKAGAVTRQKFQDFTLHLEFRIPLMSVACGKDCNKNGVLLQNHYRVQILDSFGVAKPGVDACGAIYGECAPRINMCFPPLAWQTYDIDFAVPRFDDSGKKVANARVGIRQNGVVVQDNHEVPAVTIGESTEPESSGPAPLTFGSDRSPIDFRNIWLVEKK